MAWFSFLDPILNVALGWMLVLPPFWSILILSLAISLLIVLVYKFTTKQDVMKALKDEIKTLQTQMKELRHDPNAMMDVNKRAMEANMKYMSHSMKPMLFTFLPIILVFGWLNAHFAYEPINPGHDFTMTLSFAKEAEGNLTILVPEGMNLTGDATRTIVDGKSIVTFNAPRPGTYAIEFEMAGQRAVKEVDVREDRIYLDPLSTFDGPIRSITTNHEKTKVISIGGFGVTWFWSYFIFSLVFSIALRKFMKVY